jgi:hypothetical protein
MSTPPVCDWVKWCSNDAVHELVMRNRAGTEHIAVCTLHLAAAQIYGYRPADEEASPSDAPTRPGGWCGTD